MMPVDPYASYDEQNRQFMAGQWAFASSPQRFMTEPAVYREREIYEAVGSEVCCLLEYEYPQAAAGNPFRGYEQAMLAAFDGETMTLRPVRYEGDRYVSMANGEEFSRRVLDECVTAYVPQAGKLPVCAFLAPYPQDRMEADYRIRRTNMDKWVREGILKLEGRPEGRDYINLALSDFPQRIDDKTALLIARDMSGLAISGRVLTPGFWHEHSVSSMDEHTGSQESFDG